MNPLIISLIKRPKKQTHPSATPRTAFQASPIMAWSMMLFLAAMAIPTTHAAGNDRIVDYEVLRYRAKVLAAQPYAPRPILVPTSLLAPAFTYDQHREIRFRSSEAWWRRDGLPFQLQFFHPGFVFNKTVQLAELRGWQSHPIDFSASLFEYGRTRLPKDVPSKMGFSGFRIHSQLNKAEYFDELAVFQGASYFRALCARAVYGLSARGLAIDTAEPTGEEFPIFEEFWIQRPAKEAKDVMVLALLDSPSAAGVFRFVIRPGAMTTMQVKSTLFFRRNVKVLGLAPLTSMFWHGENSADHHGDFRPEVHDSDGMLIAHGGGEWLWRPLVNPRNVRSSAFADENPRGFGLLQRDRSFNSYEDLEANYHLRPSAWVEPVGNWGKGSIRLVEIPTPDETNDNIVVFWQPEAQPAPGEPLEYEYKLQWCLDQIRPPAGYAIATRIGHSKTHEPELQRFIVDFDGPYLHNQPADPSIEAVVTVGTGAKLANKTVQKNPHNGSWRVAFALRPDGSGSPVELRCFLKKAPHVLTETWSYRWNP